jgi:hypothetical protein
MNPRLALSLLAVALCFGCTIATRTITATDGTVTKTRVSSFLTAVTGFKDVVASPDGVISSTSLDNYAGDVNSINAIGNLMMQGAKLAMLASGNTNVLVVVPTNSVAPHYFKP